MPELLVYAGTDKQVHVGVGVRGNLLSSTQRIREG